MGDDDVLAVRGHLAARPRRGVRPPPCADDGGILAARGILRAVFGGMDGHAAARLEHLHLGSCLGKSANIGPDSIEASPAEM